MKFAPIIGCALLIATPAVAASQWVEDLCWSKAARIAFMGRGAGNTYRQLHRRPHAASDDEAQQEASLLTGATRRITALFINSIQSGSWCGHTLSRTGHLSDFQCSHEACCKRRKQKPR